MEKVGKDVLKKSLRKVVERTNYVDLQVRILQELNKGKLSSQVLQKLVETLGGDWFYILPQLKETGLLEIERVGHSYFYSFKKPNIES